MPATSDKRVTYAQLTEPGASRFEERFPVLHTRMTARWSGLTDQEKLLLIHLLNKLRLGALASHAPRVFNPDVNAATDRS